MWVCESKSFSEGVSINAYGEWSRYWRGKPQGIPSPVEQNRKHIVVLERAFKAGLVDVPKRLGMTIKPDLRNIVLVANSAHIGRPRKKLEDLDSVIKADQMKARVMNDFDDRLQRLPRIIGQDRLERFGRDLAALHRPVKFDWAARFGITGDAVVPAMREPAVSPTPPQRSSGLRCTKCGVAISYAVAKFCWFNKPRFGGKTYCMDCQKAF